MKGMQEKESIMSLKDTKKSVPRILAYRWRISANYTGASKILSHASLSVPWERQKPRTFTCLICTGSIGRHGTPLIRLTSLNVMTPLNATVLSSQYGGRMQSTWLHYQKPTFRNERYARKRIFHGREGQIENPSSESQSDITRLASWFVIPDSNPQDRFFYIPLTPMIDSNIFASQIRFSFFFFFCMG